MLNLSLFAICAGMGALGAFLYDRRSEDAAVRDLIQESIPKWTYSRLEDIPAKVEELKKQTGMPVRLVLRWNESGYACSRIYPKLDLDDVEIFLRERMKEGKTIVETKASVFDADKGLPAPFGLKKAPSHICVSMRFDEAGQPIDSNATMDVIKKVFDYREVK